MRYVDVIPDSTLETLLAYVEQGLRPGSFTYAVLCNNFYEATSRADAHNGNRLKEIAAFVHNELPCICHGDAETVEAWLNDAGGVRTNFLNSDYYAEIKEKQSQSV
jgi:hypothetical protein